MNKDKVIKKIKVLERRIEIREEKKFKMVSPVGEYQLNKWKAWEYEIQIAQEELEKLLKDNFNITLFDWDLYPSIKENIYNGRTESNI